MRTKQTVLVTIVVTFFTTSALWIAGLFLLYSHFIQSADFAVSIAAPDEVARGEVFTLSVEVSNPSDQPIVLGSIDIYDSLLDGFEILAINPQPTDTDPGFGFHTAYFSKALRPGEIFKVTYDLKGIKPGLWIGDIDSCTPQEQFVTNSTAIMVRGD